MFALGSLGPLRLPGGGNKLRGPGGSRKLSQEAAAVPRQEVVAHIRWYQVEQDKEPDSGYIFKVQPKVSARS